MYETDFIYYDRNVSQIDRKRSLPQVDPSRLPDVNDPIFQQYNKYFKQHYTKGTELWQRLQKTLEDPQIWGKPDLSQTWSFDEPTNPSVSDWKDPCKKGQIFTRVDQIKNRVLPGKRFSTICSQQDFQQSIVRSSINMPKHDQIKEFFYDNWYSLEARVIMGSNLMGRIDSFALGHLDPKSQAQPTVYKAENRWWEVVAYQWNERSKYRRRKASDLKYTAQIDVENLVTRAVGADIYKFDRTAHMDSEQILGIGSDRFVQREYTPENPEFYALLGSPNGFGTGMLLITYATQLAVRDQTDPELITKVKNLASIMVQFGSKTEDVYTQEVIAKGKEASIELLLIPPVAGHLLIAHLVFVLEDVTPTGEIRRPRVT